MDLSSILPLMLNGGGDKNELLTNLLKNSGSVNKENNAAGSSEQGEQSAPKEMDKSQMLASLLKNSGSGDNKGGMDISKLAGLMGGGDKGGMGNIANLLSLANNKKTDKKTPVGLKPINNIVPNDILGIMVKYFT